MNLLVILVFVNLQSSLLFSHAKSVPSEEIDFEITINEPKEDKIVPRQEEEERPANENVPQVVASVTKIVKGIVSGNIREIIQGAFSFAPRDVSNRLISIYNEVLVGSTTEAATTTPKVAVPPTKSTNSTAATKKVVIASNTNTTQIPPTKLSNVTEVLNELAESELFPEDEEEEEYEEDDEDEFKRRKLTKTPSIPKTTKS